MLEETGAFDSAMDLPRLDLYQRPNSGVFRFRIFGEADKNALTCIIKLEAAINAIGFSLAYFDDIDQIGVSDPYVLQSMFCSSITLAAPSSIDELYPVPEGARPDTDVDGPLRPFKRL